MDAERRNLAVMDILEIRAALAVLWSKGLLTDEAWLAVDPELRAITESE